MDVLVLRQILRALDKIYHVLDDNFDKLYALIDKNKE